MTQPEVYFFDLGGTLLTPVSPGRVYAEVGRNHGSRLTEDVVGPRFRDAFRRQEALDRALGWRTDEGRELARWRAIVAQTLDDLVDFEGCFRELYDFYARPTGWRLDPDVKATFAGLRDRGARLGVGSNYDRRALGLLDAIPELAAIELRVISSVVGYRKPAAEFFAAMQAAAGASAGAIAMVGDDYEVDCLGALAVGMHAVFFDPEGKAPRPCGEPGLPRPRQVRRLLDLL